MHRISDLFSLYRCWEIRNKQMNTNCHMLFLVVSLDSKNFWCLYFCIEIFRLDSAIAVTGIIWLSWNLKQTFMCYAKLVVLCLVWISQTASVQEYTKVSQYVIVYGGKFFKSSFNMVIVHKIWWNLSTLLSFSVQ